MPNEDVVKDDAQELQDRNRNFEEQMQGAKDGILRLWERNRHQQERIARLENRLKLVTWLACAFLAGSVGLFVFMTRGPLSSLQSQLAGLQATLPSLQERLAGFDRAESSGEKRLREMVVAGETRIKQAETDLVEVVKKMAPDILATVFKNAVYVDSSGNVGVGTAKPAAKLHVAGTLLGAARNAAGKGLRIAAGKMDPQKTSWQQYSTGGISVDIDTSSAGFSATPQYFTSLGGHTNNWMAQGATSIYQPTARGFRIHVSYRDLTAAQAQEWGWYINWIAVGE